MKLQSFFTKEYFYYFEMCLHYNHCHLCKQTWLLQQFFTKEYFYYFWNVFTIIVYAITIAEYVNKNTFERAAPWSSLVEGDEGCIGPSGKLLCLCQRPKNYGIIPYLFDIWADPFVHLLLLKSSLAKCFNSIELGCCKGS